MQNETDSTSGDKLTGRQAKINANSGAFVGKIGRISGYLERTEQYRIEFPSGFDGYFMREHFDLLEGDIGNTQT